MNRLTKYSHNLITAGAKRRVRADLIWTKYPWPSILTVRLQRKERPLRVCSSQGSFSLDATLSNIHTVQFPVTFPLAKARLMAMVTGTTAPDPLQPPRDWCQANIAGAWESDAITRTLYTDSWSVAFRFERKEDATLFKLFWSEGA